MYRVFSILGILVLYLETSTQIYVVIRTMTYTTGFIASLAVICVTFVISNLTSLVLVFKDRTERPLSQMTLCCVLHGLQLGLVWRMSSKDDNPNQRKLIYIFRLIHCGLQTIPFMVVYGHLYIHQSNYTLNGVASLIALFTSCVSLAFAMTSYTVRNTNCNDKPSVPLARRSFGLFLIAFGTFMMLAVRLGNVVLMSAVKPKWVALPLGCHFLILLLTYMTCTEDATWQRRSCTPTNLAHFTILSYFNIFDLIESNLRVVQCKYVAFYALVLVENIVMAAVWLLFSDLEYVTKLVTVVFTLVVFICALISKYAGWCFIVYNMDAMPKTPIENYETIQLSYTERTDETRIRRHSSTLRTSASAGSQTTETIISPGTSISRHFSKELRAINGKENEIILDPNCLSLHPKNSWKLSKRLNNRPFFGQGQTLFHYPMTSTLKSSLSVPESFPEMNIDVPENILNIFRSDRKRVRGRKGFKLGFNRTFASNDGGSMDTPTSAVRKLNDRKKLCRTDSYPLEGFKGKHVWKPKSTNLKFASDWNNLYSTSQSTTSPSSCICTEERTTTSVTGSATNMSFSDSIPWMIQQRPQFENLETLPQKSMDSDKRIRNWLSETVSLFDLLYEKSASEALKSGDDTTPSSYSDSESHITRTKDRVALRKSRRRHLNHSSHDAGYSSVENILVDEPLKESLGISCRNSPEIPKTTNAKGGEGTETSCPHGKSLNKIKLLKQFIVSAEHQQINSWNDDRLFIPIQNQEKYVQRGHDVGDSCNASKNDTNDFNLGSLNSAMDTCFYTDVALKKSALIQSRSIRRTFSCPGADNSALMGDNSLYTSCGISDAFYHKPLMTSESLV